jgi:putative ABC transport system permease protein
LVLRQLAADPVPTAVLALLLMLGAFLGAAMPRWVDARLDATLRQLVETSGRKSELLLRVSFEGSMTEAENAIPTLRSDEPDLAAVYDQGRWSAAVGEGEVLSSNGTPIPDLQPLVVDVRAPDRLEDKVRLVDGRFPAEAEFPPPLEFGARDVPEQSPLVEVVAVPAVAEGLRMQVGDVLLVHRDDVVSRQEGIQQTRWPRRHLGVRLVGLVEPADPADRFWSDAPTTLSPTFERGENATTVRGAVLMQPEAMAPFVVSTQTLFTGEWRMDAVPGALATDTVGPATTALRRVEQDTSWRTSFDDLLVGYAASRSSGERVSALGVASLAGLVVAVLLLAARLVAERRAEALRLTRIRGGSDSVLVQVLLAEAMIVGVPAVLLGVAAASQLIPTAAGSLPFILPAIFGLIVIAGLPITGIAVARQSAADRPDLQGMRPSTRRLVFEAGVVILSLAGLWLLANRDPAALDGIDPVVSLAPLLAATAAGLLTFRLVPFVVTAAVRWSARGRGVTAFLAATRAARSPGHAVLPVIAVLVAVGIAAFGTTVRSTVDRAQQMASWDAVKADAAVEAPALRVAADDLPGLITGETAVAAGYRLNAQRVQAADGRNIGLDLLAVDVPAWERVVAAAPAVVDPVEMLARADTAHGDVPGVITGQISGLEVGERFTVSARGADLTVELVDKVSDFPGARGDVTLVLPASAVSSGFGLQWPTVVYAAGDVDEAQLAEALNVAPEQITLRSQALELSTTDPVLDATVDVFRTALLVAGVLAAIAAVLGLLITQRSRSYALSILRTLGLTPRQAGVIVAMDVVPTITAAAAVGVVVGLGIGRISSQALNLSGLTGLVVTGDDVVLDPTGTAVTAAGVLGVVLVAVATAVTVNRRARLGAVLRAGDRQ